MILGIYGTGGTGREIYYMVTCTSLVKDWEKIVYIDDTIPRGYKDGVEVYPLSEIKEKFDLNNLKVCIAVGEPRVKNILLNKIKEAGIKLATLIHPDAFVSPDAILEDGVMVKKNALVSSKAKVGSNSCLQEYSIVGHDAEVGENCQISSMVAIGGFTKIGANTYIGLSAALRDRIAVGENSVIGMGAVVQRDVPNGVIVMGNPARVIQKNETGKIFK